MFTPLARRHKKNLSHELKILNERIQIDGLRVDHNTRLATYLIDALKFDQGLNKLEEIKANFPNDERALKSNHYAHLLNELFVKTNEYNSQPDKEKLINIAALLEILVKEKLYPRIERKIEDKIYADIFREKVIINSNSIFQLSTSLINSDEDFKRYLQIVNKLQDFRLTNKSQFDQFDKLIKLLTGYQSFLEMLRFSVGSSLSKERLIKNIRKTYLLNHQKIKFNYEHLNMLNAISEHCFLNEFLYSYDDEEKIFLQQLETDLSNSKIKKGLANDVKLLILFCYKELPLDQGLLEQKKDVKILKNILSIKNSKKIEEEIKKEIPVKLVLNDSVSEAVREQYEENPYPRWEITKILHEGATLKNWLSSYSKKFRDKKYQDIAYPKILIAGTGTGQQAISTASVIKNASVDAFDLSKSSLAYAIRKKNEFKLKNINFFQADLFNIDFIADKYDLVQCSGVLHHTSNPLGGLKSLKSKCSKNGIIQIGLYSKYARAPLNKIRDEVKALNIGTSHDEILEYRNKIIDENHYKDELRIISTWGDFYSTSMFRDLCFHKQEIQFDCMDIKNLINEAGLKFVCMMLKPKMKKFFEIQTGILAEDASLDVWHEFELKNKLFFVEMYNFLLISDQ